MLVDIEEGDSELSLAMILSFATGCSAVPPIGFSPVVPWIAFLHDPEADGNKSKSSKSTISYSLDFLRSFKIVLKLIYTCNL